MKITTKEIFNDKFYSDIKYYINNIGGNIENIIIKSVFDNYNNIGEYCLEIETDDISKYKLAIQSLIRFEINKHQTIFQNFTTELKLKGLDYTKIFNDNSTIDMTRNTNGHSYGMNEDAPINSDIEIINTPYKKVQTQNNNNETGKDTTTKNYNETNPYYYEQYMNVVKKYNILLILDSCAQSVIDSYNTII